MTFEQWLEAVDKEFIRVTGLDRDSWPDQDYYFMYEDKIRPAEAVYDAIENEYGEEGIDSFYPVGS